MRLLSWAVVGLALGVGPGLGLVPPARGDASPPLVNFNDLAKQYAKHGLGYARLLDVRPRADYDAGHIENAIWVDLKQAEAIAARPGGLTDRDAWLDWITPFGLFLETQVFIIGNNRQLDAARTWWLLRYLGVPKVSLLNGDFDFWKAQRRLITQQTPDVEPHAFPVDFETDRLATRADVLAALKAKDAQIIDARSVEEWVGKNVRARRGGHIPDACRIEWVELVDRDGRFPDVSKLHNKLNAAGIDFIRPKITHCQSGGRASVDAFALELIGQPSRNYYLSWADWGNADDTPITTEESPVPATGVAGASNTPEGQANNLALPTPEAVQVPRETIPAAPQPNQPPAPPAGSKPFVAEYYYKCHWGRSDEFLFLFEKNHLPILRERIKQGNILKVSMTKPRIHENEFGRWDYRVTIEFRDAASAFDPATDEAIKVRLFPDQGVYRQEEQRRFELLDAHWDLPIDDVDLDKPVSVP